jgi:formate transporter
MQTKNDGADNMVSYDPKLSPKELSGAISALGMKKANTRFWQLTLLGILAGLYVSFGSMLYMVALAEGLGKVVGGLVFSVGLVLVLIAGAELFTGNVIMLVGTITGLFALSSLLRNWVAVYIGNFVGSVLTAALIWRSGLLGDVAALNGLGDIAVSISDLKLSLTFEQCVIRGIFCNMLVILAIIMATMAKDIVSKILCIVIAIMTFVACGFEHCVANMFLIPLGLTASGAGLSGQLTMFANILPVTLGNIIGGILILLIHPNRIRQIVFLLQRYWGATRRSG